MSEKTPVLAIIALVLAFIFPLVGLILGIVALSDSKKRSNSTGRGLSIAAIIIGSIFTLLTLFIFTGAMAFFNIYAVA